MDKIRMSMLLWWVVGSAGCIPPGGCLPPDLQSGLARLMGQGARRPESRAVRGQRSHRWPPAVGALSAPAGHHRRDRRHALRRLGQGCGERPAALVQGLVEKVLQLPVHDQTVDVDTNIAFLRGRLLRSNALGDPLGLPYWFDPDEAAWLAARSGSNPAALIARALIRLMPEIPARLKERHVAEISGVRRDRRPSALAARLLEPARQGHIARTDTTRRAPPSDTTAWRTTAMPST